MSEATGAAGQAAKMKANQTFVVGRINYTGGFDSNGQRVHEARIAIAAPDQFSMPGAVMVQSRHRIGNVGEDVSLLCEVTGFPDKFTDRSGEVKQTARNVLRVVD